eukprot:353289-Chlamydomonas_euryale.AAC.2
MSGDDEISAFPDSSRQDEGDGGRHGAHLVWERHCLCVRVLCLMQPQCLGGRAVGASKVVRVAFRLRLLWNNHGGEGRGKGGVMMLFYGGMVRLGKGGTMRLLKREAVQGKGQGRGGEAAGWRAEEGRGGGENVYGRGSRREAKAEAGHPHAGKVKGATPDVRAALLCAPA